MKKLSVLALFLSLVAFSGCKQVVKETVTTPYKEYQEKQDAMVDSITKQAMEDAKNKVSEDMKNDPEIQRIMRESNEQEK